PIRLGCDPVEEIPEPLELRRPARLLLVDEERAVRSHPAHEERHAQAKKIHLGQVVLAHDLSDGSHVRVVQGLLLVSGWDPQDLDRARRELESYGLARSAKQDRPEPMAEIVQVLEASERAILVAALMPMKKAKAGAEPMGVDEGDHRVQVIEPVLQRRARQHESEARGQSLDDPAGLRLPVLDALPLVEDDEVPASLLDVQI